jgi:hypothetical protein
VVAAPLPSGEPLATGKRLGWSGTFRSVVGIAPLGQ